MERLKVLRQRLKKTQKEMAEALGVGLRAYQMYEEGKRKLPPDKMQVLAKVFKVNLHWLLTGEGEPFITETEGVKKKTKALLAI